MSSGFNIRALPLAVALVALMVATTLWYRFSWAIVDIPAPPHLLGGFPVAGLIALLLVLLSALFHVGMGWVAAGHSMRASGIPGNGAAAAALCLLVGEALLAILSGWLGFFLIFPGVVPALGMILAGLVLLFTTHRPRRPRFRLKRLGTPEIILVGIVVVLGFIAAMAPLAHSDGLRYHLPAPSEWLREGRFVNLPYNANSNLPALQGLVAANWSGRVLLPQTFQALGVVHYFALVLLAGSLSVSCLRSLPTRKGAGSNFRKLEWCTFASGVVLAGSIPLLALLAAWPFSDVMAATFFLGALRCLAPGLIRSAIWRLALTSLLLGGAAASKLSLLPLCSLVGVFAFFLGGALSARGKFHPVTVAMAILVPGLLIIGPWMIKSTLFHGNPVYPVAWGVFGGPEWSEENDALYRHQASMKGVPHTTSMFLQTPWLVTRYWASFESFNPGPHFLAFLPVTLGGLLILLVGTKPRRRWMGVPLLMGLPLLLLYGWVVWFFSYQSTRFLLPVKLLAVIAGVGLIYRGAGMLPAWGVGMTRLVLGICALVPLAWAPMYNLRTEHSLRAGLGLVGPEIHLARPPSVFNAFPAVQWLNQNTERNEPVLYIGEHRQGHALTFRPIASDWFDTPMVLVEIRRTDSNTAMFQRWREMGIRYILWNQAELSAYETQAFRPRFNEVEWERFEALRRDLESTILQVADDGVYICSVP